MIFDESKVTVEKSNPLNIGWRDSIVDADCYYTVTELMLDLGYDQDCLPYLASIQIALAAAWEAELKRVPRVVAYMVEPKNPIDKQNYRNSAALLPDTVQLFGLRIVAVYPQVPLVRRAIENFMREFAPQVEQYEPCWEDWHGVDEDIKRQLK